MRVVSRDDPRGNLGREFRAVQWDGTNLEQLLFLTGKHPSVGALTAAGYRDLIAHKGFKIIADNFRIYVDLGMFLVEDRKGSIEVLTAAKFHELYEVVE